MQRRPYDDRVSEQHPNAVAPPPGSSAGPASSSNVLSTERELPPTEVENPSLQLDEFGNAPFSPLCFSKFAEKMTSFAVRPDSIKAIDGEPKHACTKIPWSEREVPIVDHTSWFHILKTPYFWNKTELAFRATLIGLLPPAILITASDTQSAFVSASVATIGGLIGSAGAFGMSLWIVLQFFKATMFWLPFCTAMIAARLWESNVAWNFVYSFGCFFICIFGTNFTKRLCLIGFNICLIAQQYPTGQSITFPSHVAAEFCIGFGFGILSTLIPYPLRSGAKVDMVMKIIAGAIVGIMPVSQSSFWLTSNVERRFVLAKHRVAKKIIDEQVANIGPLLMFTDYEWIFGVENMLFRKHKYLFLDSMAHKVGAISRVLDIIADAPTIVSESKRLPQFQNRLEKPLIETLHRASEAIAAIGNATTRKQALKALDLAAMRAAVDEFEKQYQEARNELYRTTEIIQIEEAVYLFSYYVFCVHMVVETVEEFAALLNDKENKTQKWPPWYTVVLMFFVTPFIEVFNDTKLLLTGCSQRELRIVVEAAKVSGAMIAAVQFFIFMNPLTAFVSGPTVIAFCASENAGDAIQVSFNRLFGTMFGAVIGFFGDSYATTPVQKVATLCTIVCVCAWFRDGKKYGPAAFYSAFVALSMISLVSHSNTSANTVVVRIQQNTFSVVIYILIALFIYPAKPAQTLREARCRVYDALNVAYGNLATLFTINIDDKAASNAAIAKAAGAVMAVRGALRAEKMLLQSPEDEPLLHYMPFPATASRQMTLCEERLCGILETAVRSWKLLVNCGDNSISHFSRFLLSMSSPTQDIAISFAASMNLLKTVVIEPHSDVVHEVVETISLYFILARELHQRKSNGFINIIGAARKTVGLEGNMPIGTRHGQALHSIIFCLSQVAPELRMLAITAQEMHNFDAAAY